MKKLITVLLAVVFFKGLTATASAEIITFSENVTFVHDYAYESSVPQCPWNLNYDFLSESVALPQFDPSLGVLTSVELVVESSIDVKTSCYYWNSWDGSTQWWYSDVVASVEGLEATVSQDHSHDIVGTGRYYPAFTIDGVESDSTLSDLTNFIGTGSVDVSLTGNNTLCASNRYWHYDTATDGSVTVSLNYEYYDYIADDVDIISVEVDIKPGSCPNPLNVKSKGVLPVAILGTEEFDVYTIDPASVRLTLNDNGDGVPVLRSAYEDVATPFEGELCGCHDYSGDGYQDLTLKFDAPELVEMLGLDSYPGDMTLTIKGNLYEEFGGTPIIGQDCIRIK